MIQNIAAMQALTTKATPTQRAAAQPHAVAAAKAETPRERAHAVICWLRALGEDPAGWRSDSRAQRLKELSGASTYPLDPSK